MNTRPRRLRDFFNQLPNRDRSTTPIETDELIDEITATHELDIEGIALDINRSHRRLWHKVENEIEEESKRKD